MSIRKPGLQLGVDGASEGQDGGAPTGAVNGVGEGNGQPPVDMSMINRANDDIDERNIVERPIVSKTVREAASIRSYNIFLSNIARLDRLKAGEGIPINFAVNTAIKRYFEEQYPQFL